MPTAEPARYIGNVTGRSNRTRILTGGSTPCNATSREERAFAPAPLFATRRVAGSELLLPARDLHRDRQGRERRLDAQRGVVPALGRRGRGLPAKDQRVSPRRQAVRH